MRILSHPPTTARLPAFLKRVARALVPGFTEADMAERRNRHGQRLMDRAGVPQATAHWLATHGLRVRSGPFAGMQYVTAAVGSSILPKLVGSYESELHPWLEEIVRVPYDVIVDVGAAEGYYAVGLAWRGASRVLAFDLDGTARTLCETLARANGVADRVAVHGACDHERLSDVLRGRGLVMCDCEGYEDSLLDPIAVPSLRGADILVELHDVLRPGVTRRIEDRFRATHSVDYVDTRERDPDDWPGVDSLPPQWRDVAVSEFRNDHQQWAFLRAHSPAR